MAEEITYKPAVLWKKAGDEKVDCFLCNHHCKISESKVGRCMVRRNFGGELYSLNYDKLVAANADPIEKKPLFHFQPGTESFSIATVGCNFQCDFCQNWQISQQAIEYGQIDGKPMAPESIVDNAVKSGCSSIAYTYTEPTIFMELAADTGICAKEEGLANVFVSNGFMTQEAIDFAGQWLDGINVDLKAFSKEYYRDICKGKLQPVLDNISYIARHTDIWIEVTTLVVPWANDSEEELRSIAEFIVKEAGEHVPWHISRFHPQYKHQNGGSTPMSKIEQAYEIGKEAGLRYVYPGNVPGMKAESTFCYSCGRMLIERSGYRILVSYIENSCCPDCGAQIDGFGL